MMILILLSGLYVVNTVFLLIIAIREVRRPSNALMWLTIGLVIPIIGFGMYLIMARTLPVLPRKRLTSPQNESETLPDSFSETAQAIAHASHSLSVGGLRRGGIQILTNGINTYERLIASILSAQKTIDIGFYIYRDDAIGKELTNVIIEKALEGIRIRFMKDGIGSRQFPRTELVRMQEAGVECRTTFPFRFPWLSFTLNYRNHCKNVVIDGEEAFNGGTNVGDEYTGLKPGVGYWRDTNVRIVGEAAVDILTIFDAQWDISSPEKARQGSMERAKQARQSRKKTTGSHTRILTGMMVEWGSELGIRAEMAKEVLSKAYVQTFEGNPEISTQVIRQSIFICLTHAKRTIDLITPYFLPEDDIMMALKAAVARGVHIRLLVPLHVDHKIVGLASRTYYGELLEAGIHIYMYDKGVLHPKVMVIDGEVSQVGAANIDIRSFRLNYEVCSLFYSKDIAEQLTEQFEQDLNHCVPLHMDDVVQRSLPQRLIEQAARIFSPLL